MIPPASPGGSAWTSFPTTGRNFPIVGLLADEILMARTSESADGSRTVLDIGCGNGIGDLFDRQIHLGALCRSTGRRYIGVDPKSEAAVAAPSPFHEVLRTSLEDAPLDANSVDVAYAAYVLEHLSDPSRFFARLHAVLKDGGVFLAVAPDSRHFFAKAARLFQSTKLKRWYLQRLGRHEQAEQRVYYLANSPRQIREHARRFRLCEFRFVVQPSIIEGYVHPGLRAPLLAASRCWSRVSGAGPVLLARLVK